MSLYNAVIQKLNEYSASISKQASQSASIEIEETVGNIKIQQIDKMRGSMMKQPFLTASVIMSYVAHKFFRAFALIFSGKAAKLVGAPATNLLSENQINTATFASLLGSTAAKINVDSMTAFSNKVFLAVCGGALLAYSKHVPTLSDADLKSIHAAVAKGMKEVKIERTFRAHSSTGKVLGTYKKTFYIARKADAISGNGENLGNAKRAVKIGVLARAFSATLQYASILTSGIFYTGKKSKALSAPGKMMDTKDGVINSGHSLEVVFAPGHVLDTAEGEIHSGHSVEVGSANGQSISEISGEFALEHSVAVGKTKAVSIPETVGSVGLSHEAIMRAWSMPILENGVLYIRQVYDAVQTDESLEVI